MPQISLCICAVSKLNRRLHRLIRVYICQNATLLEITCRSSYLIYMHNIGKYRSLSICCAQNVHFCSPSSHGHFSHRLTLYTRTTASSSQIGENLSASFKLFIYNYDGLVHIINRSIPFRNSALKS